MNIYQNWDTFISKIDIAPQQLDEEKLKAMVEELSNDFQDRVALREKARVIDRVAFESLVKSYVPIVVSNMKEYASKIGYDRDVLMICIENLRKMLADTLNDEVPEEDINEYVKWMVENEVNHFIASNEKKQQKISNETIKEEFKDENEQEIIDKISEVVSDDDQGDRIKKILSACRNDSERQLLSFRYGLEDGVIKTLQETADKFKITRERARLIEARVIRRITPHLRRRKSLLDHFND